MAVIDLFLMERGCHPASLKVIPKKQSRYGVISGTCMQTEAINGVNNVFEPLNTTDRNANAMVLFITIQVGINIPLLLEHTDQQFLVRQVKLLRVEIESAIAFTAIVHKLHRQT